MNKVVEEDSEALRYGAHQTARGALADAEKGELIYLFKNCSELKVTYQIRLLAFRATHEGKTLIIRMPKRSRAHPTLQSFVRALRPTVRVEKV